MAAAERPQHNGQRRERQPERQCHRQAVIAAGGQRRADRHPGTGQHQQVAACQFHRGAPAQRRHRPDRRRRCCNRDLCWVVGLGVALPFPAAGVHGPGVPPWRLGCPLSRRQPGLGDLSGHRQNFCFGVVDPVPDRTAPSNRKTLNGSCVTGPLLRASSPPNAGTGGGCDWPARSRTCGRRADSPVVLAPDPRP